MLEQRKSVMVIAGEPSGDMHAGRLVAALRKRHPHLDFFGIGGPTLRKAGVELLHSTDEMAVMGLSEVLRRFSFFRRVFKEMLGEVARRKPVAVILVDYPGFNLRFAAAIRGRGVKVIYYISPQVWAWHQSRIPTMARIIDHLIVIFPFETECFRGTGLRVDFAGHPLVDIAAEITARPPAPMDWKRPRRVAVLPGSREHEVRRLLPVFATAADRVAVAKPDTSFIFAAANPEMERIGRGILAHRIGADSPWSIVVNNAAEVMRQAEVTMIASGTATVEAALMGCPMVIAYRMAPLTYMLARRLVRVDHIGMVNIIAGQRLCPEFVQHEATPDAIGAEVLSFLGDEHRRAECVKGLGEVSRRLGLPGAVDRAADLLGPDLA